MDKIMVHEDWWQTPLRAHVSTFWRIQQRGKPLPPCTPTSGTVKAVVNHGRWVVECPNGCGDALCVSDAARCYICCNCGGKTWYHVAFPRDRKGIEAVLLQRKAQHPFLNAPTRNWMVGETVKDLEAENALHPEAVR